MSNGQLFYNSSSYHHHHLYALLPPMNNKQQQLRNYSTTSVPSEQQLTHIDEHGKAHMVDVSTKRETIREATASATVVVGPKIAALIATNELAKGDVLSVAQLAGIMGAKHTANLIPLCHNIALNSVKVVAKLVKEEEQVRLTATVRCSGKTGVEMEALTAVSIAALTVYDMCKAVSHDILITDIRLMSKSGGKREFQRWPQAQ